MKRPLATASLLAFRILAIVERHERTGTAMSPELCGAVRSHLVVLAEQALALEAVTRAVDLLGEREFAATVTALPVADRRAIARSALRRVEGNVIRLPVARVDQDMRPGGDAA